MRTKSMIQEYQEFYETKLPTRFEVCDRCSGHGTHVNPAIDGHGVTADEWNDWGEESQSMYLSGGYDVSCHECDGMRVVLIVVEDSLIFPFELRPLELILLIMLDEFIDWSCCVWKITLESFALSLCRLFKV